MGKRTALALGNTWTQQERGLLASLRTPGAIQDYLDGLAYSCEDSYRCPRRVMQESTAHCFDGAVFAAAALRGIGQLSLIVDLIPNGHDDDHVLALFKADGHWGAIAKSNFVGLRYREPVYRTLRELVMSYFEQYYNVARMKTLAGYTRPLNLASLDRLDWMSNDGALDVIAERLDQIRRFQLLTRRQARRLLPVDERSYRAGLLDSRAAGLYQPDAG